MVSQTSSLTPIKGPAKISPKTFLKRSGKWALFILHGGAIILLGCAAFISFLWLSPTTNTFWKKICIQDIWVLRSITIASLIIRWAITTHAALATAMLAALALEKGGATLSELPALSCI